MKLSHRWVSDKWASQLWSVLLIWSLVSLFITLKSSFFGPYAYLNLISVKGELMAWAFSLVFIPMALLVVRWYKLRPYWLLSILMNLGIALILSMTWELLSTREVKLPLEGFGASGFVSEGGQWNGAEGRFFQRSDLDMFSSYLLIAGIAYAVSGVAQLRVREMNELNLKQLLSQSKLNQLKAQIHPHFMFNTLNTVSGLMEKDVDQAQLVLEDFGFLLRSSLNQSEQAEVALEDELEFLKKYLQIEQVRFGDIFRVIWEVDPDCRGASVPHMLLQPLAENAVKHAFVKGGTGNELVIRAQKSGEKIRLELADNGVGLKKDWQMGVGLSLVKDRVLAMFPDKGLFEVEDAAEGGTVVTIEIPYTISERNYRVLNHD